jgi:phosphonate transport system substrate-binding protein
MRQSLLIVAACLACLSLLLTGCAKSTTSAGSTSGGSSAPTATGEPIKLGVIPYEASTSKEEEEYQPLAAFFGKDTGRPTTVTVAGNYIGVVQALQADQIDVAYLNPLSYVLFADKMRNTPEHLIPIAMPYVHGTLYYYGVIFTRTDTGIKTLADLKGKKFVFTQPTSTSGYLYPFNYMLAHGINPDKDLGQKEFAGTDAAVVPAVLNGSADAGAVFEEGLTMYANPDQQKQLKVIAKVGPIANGMFVARGNLDAATLAAVKKAFVDVNTDPQGQAALKGLGVAKMAPADDSVFDPVRKAATTLGLNLQSLSAQKKK